jgi:hypothetical protein
MTIKTRTQATPAKTDADTNTAKRKTLTRARKADAGKVSDAKQADIIDATLGTNDMVALAETTTQGVALEGLDRPVTGRGVFAVRTLGTAVSVESAFLEESGNVLRLPAVFPNRQYAQSQLEELWQIVNQHFDALDELAAKGND